MDYYGFVWISMDCYGFVWMYGLVWTVMVLSGFVWILVCSISRVYVAPLFGPTRLAGPNRIQNALIPLKCSDPRA